MGMDLSVVKPQSVHLIYSDIYWGCPLWKNIPYA